MKIFLFLNDCLLGENTTLELLFIYLRNSSWKERLSIITDYKNIKTKIKKYENQINFNNLFLRLEVIDKLHTIGKEGDEVFIVTDLENVPIESLHLDRDIHDAAKLIKGQTTQQQLIDQNKKKYNYKISTCTYKEYYEKVNILYKINESKNDTDFLKKQKQEEDIDSDTDYGIITGEFISNRKYFFHAKRIIFVGNYFVGKLIDIFSGDRNKTIETSDGIISIIWDYYFNFFSNIFILWPLLFFLPSTSFVFWKMAFFFSVIMNGTFLLWRTFLELENERKHEVNGYEVLIGNNFIYLHHSTFYGLTMSIIITILTTIYGFTSWVNFKALLFSFIYNFIIFLFYMRKEYIGVKLTLLLILPLIFQPLFYVEFFKTIITAYL